MKSYSRETFTNDKARLDVTPDLCKGCEICVAFCPENVLGMHRERVVVLDMERCTACGLCELRCPDFAIEVTNLARSPKAKKPQPFQTGKPWPQPSGDFPAGPWGKKVFMQGNEACAEGAIYAGCRFFAGYPITPSTEVAEILSARLPAVGGSFVQMEDELASAAAIIGASLTGTKAMTSTSGPGFSLMQENLGYASHTEIPIVLVDIMRGGPSTGLPTAPAQSDVQQARWGTHGDHPIIAITPGSVGEMFTQTVRAFNLSERFRVPVVILADEIIAHMREAVQVPKPGDIEIIDRPRATGSPEEYEAHGLSEDGELVPRMASFGDGYRFHVTGLSYDSKGFPAPPSKAVHTDQVRKMEKISKNLDEIELNEEYLLDDAEIAIVAYGSSALSARPAIQEARAKGVKVGLFRPITFWPFPYHRIEELSRRVRAFVVPEMNLGQALIEVERAVAGRCPIKPVQYVGGESIKPKTILEAVMEVSR